MRGFELVEPDDAVFDRLIAELDIFNRRHTDWSWKMFGMVHRASDGEIVAGGRGIVKMGMVEIRAIWVADALRGTGLGRQLLTAIEAEGIRRGASVATLDTYSWQSPGFYEYLGYREWGRMGYPNGTERIFLRKEL